MLIAGQEGADALTLAADLYFWGIVMIELAVAQHREFTQDKSPVEEGTRSPTGLKREA